MKVSGGEYGAGIALDLAGQSIQVELLRPAIPQPQVEAEDLLAFGVSRMLPHNRIITLRLKGLTSDCLASLQSRRPE